MEYTYSDSQAGKQSVRFNKLSDLIKHIEDFGHAGEEESFGIVYEDDIEILAYRSHPTEGLDWSAYVD